MTIQTAADLLDAGADYIETHGHSKGRPYGPSDEACFYGAMARTTDHATYERFYAVAARAVLAELGVASRCTIDVIDWNDAEATTPTDVIDTMRHAAKRRRAGAR